MTNFIIKKQGSYKVYVMVDYAMAGEFTTTDSTLIDDIQYWLDGKGEFMNFDTRSELEYYVRGLAGIESKTIAGVDFFKNINDLFNL